MLRDGRFKRAIQERSIRLTNDKAYLFVTKIFAVPGFDVSIVSPCADASTTEEPGAGKLHAGSLCGECPVTGIPRRVSGSWKEDYGQTLPECL